MDLGLWVQVFVNPGKSLFCVITFTIYCLRPLRLALKESFVSSSQKCYGLPGTNFFNSILVILRFLTVRFEGRRREFGLKHLSCKKRTWIPYPASIAEARLADIPVIQVLPRAHWPASIAKPMTLSLSKTPLHLHMRAPMCTRG